MNDPGARPTEFLYVSDPTPSHRYSRSPHRPLRPRGWVSLPALPKAPSTFTPAVWVCLDPPVCPGPLRRVGSSLTRRPFKLVILSTPGRNGPTQNRRLFYSFDQTFLKSSKVSLFQPAPVSQREFNVCDAYPMPNQNSQNIATVSHLRCAVYMQSTRRPAEPRKQSV